MKNSIQTNSYCWGTNRKQMISCECECINMQTNNNSTNKINFSQQILQISSNNYFRTQTLKFGFMVRLALLDVFGIFEARLIEIHAYSFKHVLFFTKPKITREFLITDHLWNAWTISFSRVESKPPRIYAIYPGKTFECFISWYAQRWCVPIVVPIFTEEILGLNLFEASVYPKKRAANAASAFYILSTKF